MIHGVAATMAHSVSGRRDLSEVCQEFEALFIGELLKPLDDALAGDSHQGMLAPLARRTVATSLSGSLGIGELLYQQLAAQAGLRDDGPA